MPVEIYYENNLSEAQSLINQIESHCDILEKFSSYKKINRVIAWIKRFSTNEKIKGPLNTTELNKACKTVIQLVQQSAFSTEIKSF